MPGSGTAQSGRAPGTDARGLRVVITHDFMEAFGGAERVTAEMAQAFPNAPVVAILGRREVAERMGVESRFTSLLPSWPTLLRRYRVLTPVFPVLTDRMRVPAADVVLSSSYAFAHRLRSRNDAPRVCYSHSPLRFAWSMTEAYGRQWGGGGVGRSLFGRFAGAMRDSDCRSSAAVDRYLATGSFVAGQIESFYGREATTLGPPVDCEMFRPTRDGASDFWLFCGRLIEPYKKVRILVEAFNRLRIPLVIAGDGPERAALERSAAPNVEFTGMLGDRELVDVMGRCRAAVFPSRDDFGLIPVEVMACGRPVLAFAGGGALDTVAPGITGELFADQSVEALVAAVEAFDPDAYDPVAVRGHALQWDCPRFRERLVRIVAEVAEGREPAAT